MLAPGTLPAQVPPAVLQITIERVQAGGEARYGELEERMAETCARLGCPNAYLALESVAGPKEVWWFVEYADEADVARVARAYAENAPLLAALTELAALKKDITDPAVEHMTRLRGDAAEAPAWRVGLEPFVVIAPRAAVGAVFESSEHAIFTILAALSSTEAARAAAELGAGARILSVQPAWSRPKDEWVDASPEIWRR